MRHLFAAGALWLAALALGGCGSSGGTRPAAPASPTASTGNASGNPASPSGPGPTAKRGGYYMDDGPGENPPPNLEQTPDAIPRDEPPLKSAANRPYVVFGKTYTPALSAQPLRQRGVASWYGRKFHGQRTSSGEPYNMYGMSAAHPTLPIPSYVRVTNLSNGRAVVVRVNDRGPFHSERIIDLSYTAALKLGYIGQGSAQVEVEQVKGDGSPAPPVLVATAPVAPAVPANASPIPRPAEVPAAPPANATPVPGPSPVVVGAPVVSTSASASANPAAAPAATAAATPAATQTLPTSTQPDGVYLQLGAFGAREGADEFRTKVYQQLPWLNDAIYIVARDRLFRVQLGPYKDRAEAGAMAEKLRQGMQLTPVFVLK